MQTKAERTCQNETVNLKEQGRDSHVLGTKPEIQAPLRKFSMDLCRVCLHMAKYTIESSPGIQYVIF